MEYLILNNSDLKVSRLCMGGCPMGEYGWGNVVKENVLQAIDCALDEGINFFDTADIYGLGKSEENLGRALSGKRSKAVIATKFGVRIENGVTIYDNSPAWIESAILGSLKRLKTDYIDLYQVHYRDKNTRIEEVVDSLERLKKKGYIRYYGLSNISDMNIDELMEMKGRFVSFQNEYSLANRSHEKIIIKAEKELGLSLMTWGSLGQGILTGKYTRYTKFDENDRRSRENYVNFHGDRLLKNLQIVEEMKKIANYHKRTLASVALRWIMDYRKGSVVLAGIKNKSQVLGNTDAFGWNLSPEELKILDQISN